MEHSVLPFWNEIVPQPQPPRKRSNSIADQVANQTGVEVDADVDDTGIDTGMPHFAENPHYSQHPVQQKQIDRTAHALRRLAGSGMVGMMDVRSDDSATFSSNSLSSSTNSLNLRLDSTGAIVAPQAGVASQPPAKTPLSTTMTANPSYTPSFHEATDAPMPSARRTPTTFAPIALNPNEAYSMLAAMLPFDKFMATYRIDVHMQESKKKPLFRGVHLASNTQLAFKHVHKAEEWVYHFAIQYSEQSHDGFHPHIIQLYHVTPVPMDGIVIDGRMYYNGFLLAMEHAGNDQPDLLHQHLSATGKAQRDMHKVLAQCASAMVQVHTCTQQPTMGERVALKSVISAVRPAGTLLPRLLHNDIKPDNFFLTSPQHVKLGDFGGADVVGKAPSTVTIRYCAPEQISGHSSVSSDWYGLAATMYCLVSGRHFRDCRISVVADLPPKERRAIIRGELVKPLETIHSYLARVFDEATSTALTRALSTNEADRPNLLTLFSSRLTAQQQQQQQHQQQQSTHSTVRWATTHTEADEAVVPQWV
eukprot:m.148417 g.148417  ORF g.148417 m.148417 type:complete len:534 (+) comp14178_c0_seq1:828-2429(+)